MEEPKTLKERIQKLLESMNQGLYEREEILKMVLLTSLAGENVLLLGLPGVAKSMIARRLKQAFRDSRYYEYLMSRFSTPDEIFGPVSIKGLQEDKYERKVDGYLPNANVMFLDEIFKSSPAIMNALLTVLNERLYHNGSTPMKVDVHGFIAASNELALEDGLEAFSDRFITKLVVNPIEDNGNFFSMIEGNDVDKDVVDLPLKLDYDTIKTISENIGKVALSDDAKKFITALRTEVAKLNNDWLEKNKESEKFNQQKYYFSDRRWKKAIKLLKTSAYLHGRNDIDLMDCVLLAHILWNEQEDIELIQSKTKEVLQSLHVQFDFDLIKFKGDYDGLFKEIDGQLHEMVEKQEQLKDKNGNWLFENEQKQEIAIPPNDLKKIKKNDLDSIYNYGIAYQDKVVIQVQKSGSYIYMNNQAVSQSNIFHYLSSGWKFTNTSVLNPKTRKYQAKQRTSEKIHFKVIEHWNSMVENLNAQLEQIESSRKQKLSELEERLTSHLFVTAEEAEPLKVGLAKAEIEIKNWKDKLGDLQISYQ